jgi:hypothetical protein
VETVFGYMPPPPFAASVNKMTLPYLFALKLDYDYHFPTNRPSTPGVYVEFRLKDQAGKEIATVQLPDKQANFWVRHRQSLLAQALGQDEPLVLPQGEVIAAPNQQVQEREYWEEPLNEPRHLRLIKKSENEIDRTPPHMRPSELSLINARSFARYLCRTHDAEKAEILRHHKNPIGSDVLFMENVQGGAFEEIISHFGEFSK